MNKYLLFLNIYILIIYPLILIYPLYYIIMKNLKTFDPSTDYYFNQIVKEKKENLNHYIEKTKKEIELLESVKIVTKKDWSEFQNFIKNFQLDWKMYIRSYPFENQIRISNYPIEIDIYRYSNDKEFLENIDQSRIIKESCIKDYAYFTVTEFYNEIQKTIEIRKNRLEKYQKELESFDSDLKVTIEILKNVYDLFNKLDQKIENSYYDQKEILEKTIKNFYIF